MDYPIFIRDKTEINYFTAAMAPPEEVPDGAEVAGAGVGSEFEGYR